MSAQPEVQFLQLGVVLNLGKENIPNQVRVTSHVGSLVRSHCRAPTYDTHLPRPGGRTGRRVMEGTE
jgi:hypothetical protein